MIPIERFWSKVNKTDDCWIWVAGLSPDGYGKFKSGGRTYRSTRFLWAHLHGEIPEGMHVLHDCDNKRCVKPDHLHLGTNIDNMREGVERCRFLYGSNNPAGKLTEDAVVDIRTSSLTQWELAHKYGVNQAVVWRALRGFTWRRVNQPPLPNKLKRKGLNTWQTK